MGSSGFFFLKRLIGFSSLLKIGSAEEMALSRDFFGVPGKRLGLSGKYATGVAVPHLRTKVRILWMFENPGDCHTGLRTGVAMTRLA